MPGDVVEEEERLGPGRDHVVHAVRDEVCSIPRSRPALAGEDELRARPSVEAASSRSLVEGVQACERAETRVPVDSTAVRSRSTTDSANASETPRSYLLHVNRVDFCEAAAYTRRVLLAHSASGHVVRGQLRILICCLSVPLLR